MSDDHSKVVPLLPIPNRTVKRLCANDSAGSRVKVGHRQTLTASISPTRITSSGAFVFLAGWFTRKMAVADVPGLRGNVGACSLPELALTECIAISEGDPVYSKGMRWHSNTLI